MVPGRPGLAALEEAAPLPAATELCLSWQACRQVGLRLGSQAGRLPLARRDRLRAAGARAAVIAAVGALAVGGRAGSALRRRAGTGQPLRRPDLQGSAARGTHLVICARGCC